MNTFRAPTAMRSAFEAAYSKALMDDCPCTWGRSCSKGCALLSPSRWATTKMVGESLRSTSGYRKVPTWAATRREKRR
jgi:hypothetical protein